jgi:hypothetical protein
MAALEYMGLRVEINVRENQRYNTPIKGLGIYIGPDFPVAGYNPSKGVVR